MGGILDFASFAGGYFGGEANNIHSICDIQLSCLDLSQYFIFEWNYLVFRTCY